MAELGQQTVEFSALVRRAAEESFLSLKELVERSRSAEQPESEKKIELLKYILKTRQRMLRLHVLAKWCQQVPLVQYCQQLASTLSSHDTCFTQTADSLFFMHEGLQQARAPIYDVPSAIEVLLTGSYQRLPKCVEDLSLQSTLPEDQKKPALKKLDTLLRAKLLEAVLPKEVSEAKVSDGILTLRIDGEFEVLLTLGYRGHLSMWRILHLKLLVGENGGLIKLEETRRYALGDDLERRMAVSENPLMVTYSVLHELSVALVMDTVIKQMHVLRQGRWKEAIHFTLINDGSSGQPGNIGGGTQPGQDGESDTSSLKTPGLKIIYWLDLDKITATDLSMYPFIKIEPGSDMHIKCSHSVFVLDPLSDKEAEFSLDQSCIDVEKLLLRAISCYRHTRLLEIYRELCKNLQIFRTADDVILQRQQLETNPDAKQKGNKSANEYWKDEILRVRAYGSIYISLGVNIRNGRFFLQSSKNIIEPSVLMDCEEALNQGTMTAAEVFINMRSKSIYHLIASTGKFLGLKVYEQGLNILKIPKSILSRSDFLIMGFPQYGPSFYLMMQLNRNFTATFKLLEAEPDAGDGPHSTGDNMVVVRCNEIDISQMESFEDELNLSLTDWDKLKSTFHDNKESTLAVEHLHQNLFPSPFQSSGVSKSTFSELVDEIFEFEKGSSTKSSQGVKGGLDSPKLEEGLQYPHISNDVMAASGGPTVNGSLYQISNMKGLTKNSSLASFVPSRNLQQMLPRSKSDQDLHVMQSPQYSCDNVLSSSMDDNQVKLRTAFTKDAALMTVSRPVQAMSSMLSTGSELSASTKQISVINQGQLQSVASNTCDDTKRSINLKKRRLSDILAHVPSLLDFNQNTAKRVKLSVSSHSYPHGPNTSESTTLVNKKTSKYAYKGLLAEANKEWTSSNMYLTSLLHVVRQCSLCIKHARLTGQMDSIGIPYVEEVGLRSPSSSLWFRLPFAREDSWKRICLRLGKPGSMSWDVKVNDSYFKDLWELQKGSSDTPWGSGVRIANASDMDSHIRYDPDGIVLSYKTVESDSIKKLVLDLKRLLNARLFACGMRKLLSVGCDEAVDDSNTSMDAKVQAAIKGIGECNEKASEQIRRVFKIEAVGLMSLWFSYGSIPVTVHFVVEWEASNDGCTIHVSPDQLWPHTKFLEDYINAAEVASFLDCVRLTAGPLMALGTAIRPARMPTPSSGPSTLHKQAIQSQGLSSNAASLSTSNQPLLSGSGAMVNAVSASLASHSLHSSAMLSAAGRTGPGIVPSSLLPIDVSVVLRGPYWIRIIYRKKFAVDMRCYAGDQVWLQPSTPPKDGPSSGGSLPCPQFRPFIMEHVAQGLNALEPTAAGSAHTGILASSSNSNPSVLPMVANGTRPNAAPSSGISRPTSVVGGQGTNTLNRVGNAMLASSSLAAVASGLPLRISPGTGVPVHVKGELNTAFIGLGDDGGYGGGWVPLAALKKVLRGILKYLGVLWLFAQLPELLKDILGSILKEGEGTLLNLDQEQPALRFYVGGYVFAVSVHRVQLLLQVLNVKRFHHPQPQQTQSSNQEELSSSEINEISDYFSRRVASEPYDASRVASFITLLTLPISALREFLKLLAWEKGLSQAQVGDIAPAQRARVELCLENHSGMGFDDNSDNSSVSKSNIHYDRPQNTVYFALTFVLDAALIPHVNAAGGAAWLPYCVSVRLKYVFGDNSHISLVTMDGSHGGRACWSRLEDWELCRQRVARAADIGNSNIANGNIGNGNASVDVSQGKLRIVAETMQKILHSSLQQLKDASATSNSAAT